LSIAAAAFFVVGFLVAGLILAGVGILPTVVVVLGLAGYMFLRFRNDFREGTWFEIWPNRLEWRDFGGRHSVLLGDIQIISYTGDGTFVKLMDGRELSGPPFCSFGQPGYNELKKLSPSLLSDCTLSS